MQNGAGDIREIALRSVYPDGIPVSDYSRAIKLIADLTVGGLAGYGAGNGQANGHAMRTGPRLGRPPLNGNATMGDQVRAAIASGPKTLSELMQIAGGTESTIARLAPAVGGKRWKGQGWRSMEPAWEMPPGRPSPAQESLGLPAGPTGPIKEIVAATLAHGPKKTAAIAEASGLSVMQISNALTNLKSAGRVRLNGDGAWEIKT